MAADLTDVDAFTAPVTVPEAGDDRVAASIVPAFQALADRTRNLKNRADALLTDNHIWTGDNRFDGDLKLGLGVEPLYTFLTTRKKLHSLRPIGLVAGWTYADAAGPTWVTATGATMTFYLGADELPSGGQLVAVRMLVSTAVAVTLDLARITYDTSDAADVPSAGATVSDSFTPTGTEDHILEITGLAAAIDNATSQFRLLLNPASGPSCVIRWLEYEFSDPGPRNF